MEFTLLAAALTGVATAWLGARLLVTGVDRPVDILVGAAVAGMAVGRLAAMIVDGVNPIAHPADLIIVRAGVETGPASLAALATLVWMTRDRLPEAMDRLAPSALLGLAGWHAGCVWRGTCLGTAAQIPWGWAQPGSDVTRHPVELYTVALLVVGAVVVWRLRSRPGAATGVGLAAAATARLVTEPLRPSITGGPLGWYLAGILLGGLVAIVGPRLWEGERRW